MAEEQDDLTVTEVKDNPTLDFKDFADHLEKNKRVFFSGKFGAGKTHFLQRFFEESKTHYYPIHIFPINYQIAANEDVFKYIKYDLLLNLINDKVIRKDTMIAIAKDLGRKGLLTLFEFAKETPLTNGPAKVVDNLLKLKDYWETVSESNEITMFFEEVKKKGLYEFDSISERISELIATNKGDKESVLVIDDLDRIDPGEVFRILNVFSSHQDITDINSNKFGFDKVVLVGDYENIKNIFKKKYGIDTDFNGYIDKFYSTDVFRFGPQLALLETIYDFKRKKPYGIKHDPWVLDMVYFIVANLTLVRAFNIRNFNKLTKILDESQTTHGRDFEVVKGILRKIIEDDEVIIALNKLGMAELNSLGLVMSDQELMDIFVNLLEAMNNRGGAKYNLLFAFHGRSFNLNTEGGTKTIANYKQLWTAVITRLFTKIDS